MNTGTRRIDDELVNLALGAIGCVFLVALALRGAGDAAAVLGGTARPTAGMSAGLRLVFDPGDPAASLGASGLSAVAYWAVVAAMLAILIAVATLVWQIVARVRHRTAHDPRRIVGTATRRDIAPVAS